VWPSLILMVFVGFGLTQGAAVSNTIVQSLVCCHETWAGWPAYRNRRYDQLTNQFLTNSTLDTERKTTNELA